MDYPRLFDRVTCSGIRMVRICSPVMTGAESMEELKSPLSLRKFLLGGELRFDEFMELALYDREAGYYAGRWNPVGKEGDFVTAPHLSPAFSYAIALLADEFMACAGDGLCGVVDIGCGDGSLISSVARQVAPRGRKRGVFYGVDRALGRAGSVELPDGEGVHFVETIEEIPGDCPLLVFSNELFDALPVSRVVQRSGGLNELWVRSVESQLEWTEYPARDEIVEYFRSQQIELQEGQFADVTPEWGRLYAKICRVVERGLIVTIDYGFLRRQLFDPRIRKYGTAAAFSQHQFSRDLLVSPGRQDLTAHVNFSDLVEAGEREGLETLLLTRQAKFLLSLGILSHPLFTPAQDLEIASLSEAVGMAEVREATRRLILPDGIGEEMRVLVQARRFPSAPWSFLENAL